MDTSVDVREPVSLGQCVCNANLCGRYVAEGRFVTACGFRVVVEEVSACGRTIKDQILRSG